MSRNFSPIDMSWRLHPKLACFSRKIYSNVQNSQAKQHLCTLDKNTLKKSHPSHFFDFLE